MADGAARVLHGPTKRLELPEISFGQFLLARLLQHGDRTAQVFPDSGERHTFTELAALATAVADELRRREITRGHIVAVVTDLNPEFAPLLVATQLVGAVLAPLQPGFDDGDMARMLQTLTPSIVFCLPRALEKVQNVLAGLDLDAQILPLNDISYFQPCLKMEYYEKFRFHDKDETAVIMCSSGTTGLPKGVMLSQRALMNQMFTNRLLSIYKSGDVTLQYSPNFWISGLLVQLWFIDIGLQVIAKPSFSIISFFQLVDEYKITSLFLSPLALSEVAKRVPEAKADVSSIKRIFVGGSALSRQTQERVLEVLDVDLLQCYGMTEVLLAIGPGEDTTICPGAAGQLLPNVSAEIVDETTGELLGIGDRGELYVKSPCQTHGYFRNPQATAATIDSDGWLHTGDIAYYDEHGCFFIVDRIKDLIKYKGMHVPPVELESLLQTHPGVREVAVVGVKDGENELPLAFVVPRDGEQVSKDDLINLVQDQLAEYKWLRGGVLFLDFLPKTATGKIQRRSLRQLAEQLKEKANDDY